MEYNILTDAELVFHLKKGDAYAFREIYFRHWKKLLLIARNKLPSTDNPEDLVQDIFVTLWEQRETLSITNLGAYLYTSLRNAVINRFRSRLLYEKYALQTQEVLSFAQNTEEEIALTDLMAAVERQLEDLPQKSQVIFRLNRLEYKSVKEISSQLNIPQRTVEHHISQVIRKLRLVLKDYLVMILLLLC